MQWSEQTATEDRAGRLPGYEDAVVRTFDAPEALETRFHEVHTKTALNRVPASSRVPFRWTINPYRGCTHACAYCVSGDTPILLADGRTRPIADVRVGDEIYGTVREGADRRCRPTTVLAHWSTVKRAHRVTLADGTALVASGDHRFLTERGWKHVVGAGQGRAGRRPHLTTDDSLVGAITRERTIDGQAIGSTARLDVVSIEDLGCEMPMYDITTGTGDFIANGVVSHNCFARPTHEYLDLDAGRDFEREIVVKVNVPEVLWAELARPRWGREHVALGTNTDPYQWVEGRYRLMRGIWEALRDAANPCSVLTKSPLVLRDLDLLQEIAAVTDVTACLSIPTLDEKVWRSVEPRAPNPRARLEAVAELNRAGIPTGILIAPLMPGVNDAPEQVEAIVQGATDAGAVSIGGNTLFLRGSVRQIFLDWLRAHRPDLVGRYERLYDRGAYLTPAVRHRIERDARVPWGGETFEERFRRGNRGLPDRAAPAPQPARPAPSPSPQGSLF